MNPTRSANRIDVTRRSLTAAVGALEVSGALSAAPHSPQNRSPGSLTEPQAGQATTSATPHSAQKRRPSRLSVWQLEQRTQPSLTGAPFWGMAVYLKCADA